jgi:fructoselysine-6-P-deglycase FrlB-like protein
MGVMHDDIRRQPDTLAAILARASAFRDAGARHLRPGPGGTLRSFGCGDGLFASEAVADAVRRLGLAYAPSGALTGAVHGADLVRAEDRVIAISMSGNVDRTVAAATAAARAGAKLLALCNGKGGKLAEIAQARISLDLSDLAPFLCGTSSYTATILALMLLAEGAAGRALPTELDALPDLMRETIARVDRASWPAGKITGVRFLGLGATRATADYAAAKLVELCPVPSWSADLEEFAHSQFWAMPASDLVVIFAANAEFARLAAESAEALAGMGVVTLAIDSAATPVPSATYRVTLPDAPEFLSPITQAAAAQVFAMSLARATGLDPDTRLHLKNDTARFTTSRKLTRRSLIGTGQ